jgi:general stress protein YciG
MLLPMVWSTSTRKEPLMAYPINPLTGRQIRGFGAMSFERRVELATKGGSAVPAHKRSFAVNRELSASAGAKGGAASKGGGRKRKVPV